MSTHRTCSLYPAFFLTLFCLLTNIFLSVSYTYWYQGFPGSSASKEYTCNAEDPGSIPGSGRSPGEGIGYPLQYSWASLVAQTVKNPPGTRETWVRSLGQEYPLEKGMATHSSTLAWRIPLTEAPGGLQSMGSQMTDQLSTCTYLLFGTT